MKQDKFRALCEDVLVPILNDTFIASLSEIEGTVDLIAAEVARLGELIEAGQERAGRRDDD